MKCSLCPRKCGCDREVNNGFCGVGNQLKVARAAPHYWEEPCLSGTHGSGTIFFSGCQLKCVFCQNREIRDGVVGKEISAERLIEIIYELKDQGVHNINFVTPDPYFPMLLPVLRQLKKKQFDLPILMNCSGYETGEMIRSMDGLVDIWMPDFKYWSPILSKKYSSAPDYRIHAIESVAEMVRQRPKLCYQGDFLTKGVIVRHLLLPGYVSDSEKVLAYLYQKYGDGIILSIMSQYTPFGMENYPELNRKVSVEEYDEVCDFAWKLGIRNAFIQDGEAAKESFIPDFDCRGV